jgi:hypothetical protein
MARDRGDRTDAEAMVAAEQDRHAAGREFGADALPSPTRFQSRLRQVPIAVVRRLPRIARAIEVAAIDHVDAARGERFGQAGDAQRFRAEARTAMTGADVRRRARRLTGG